MLTSAARSQPKLTHTHSTPIHKTPAAAAAGSLFATQFCQTQTHLLHHSRVERARGRSPSPETSANVRKLRVYDTHINTQKSSSTQLNCTIRPAGRLFGSLFCVPCGTPDKCTVDVERSAQVHVPGTWGGGWLGEARVAERSRQSTDLMKRQYCRNVCGDGGVADRPDGRIAARRNRNDSLLKWFEVERLFGLDVSKNY